MDTDVYFISDWNTDIKVQKNISDYQLFMQLSYPELTQELSFELREEIVYQYDGEPLNMLCISDANYGPEIGCAWYSFDDDMERVSEKFNQRYP